MTKIKHGEYDEAKHLPNNTGKPGGSGLYVWLCNEVAERFDDGTALVQGCYAHGDKRYTWLLSQVAEKQTAESAQLVAEYDEKKKYLDAVKRQQQRQRDLRNWQARHDEYPNDPWFPKKIARMQSEISKAEERWHFSEHEE